MEAMFNYDSDFFSDIDNEDMCRRFEVCLYIDIIDRDAGNAAINIYCKKTGERFELSAFPLNERTEISYKVNERVLDACNDALDAEVMDGYDRMAE